MIIKFDRRRFGVLCIAVCAAYFLFFSSSTFAQKEPDMNLSVWDAVREGDCADTITFLNDKEVLVESGAHQSIKSYKLRRVGRQGFYSLQFKTKFRNKELNCAGTRGVTVGQEHGTYLRFNETINEMMFYSAAEDDAGRNLRFRKR